MTVIYRQVYKHSQYSFNSLNTIVKNFDLQAKKVMNRVYLRKF